MSRKERESNKTIIIMQLQAELAAVKFNEKYNELTKKLSKLDAKQDAMSKQ